MSGPHPPSRGARLLFERLSVAPDQSTAIYRAAIITPEAQFVYEALLHLGGDAELRPLGDAASPEWQDRLRSHARQTARAAERRRAENLPPWPPRLLRWRQ